MPRKRNKENDGLPRRWRFYHGAYRYSVPKGLEQFWDGKKNFRLGATLAEAHKVFALRCENQAGPKTIGELLDKYAAEVIPTKAVSVQPTQRVYIKDHLKPAFEDMPLVGFRPMFVYKYVTLRSVKKKTAKGRITGGRTTALREIEVLSHAFTKAVEWGLIDRHPFKDEVRFEDSTSNRDRLIEDWEVLECLGLTSRRKKGSVLAIQAYLRIKMMTGMARGDLLRLREPDLKADGIHIQRHKTATSSGKRTIYEWTPELEAAVAMARAARPVLSPFLFCKRDGYGYFDEATGQADGWDSMWGRFVDRVLKETKVTERFTEHDWRAKCASDAETLEHARALLSHVDIRTTKRFYRRKPEVVKPLKGVA